MLLAKGPWIVPLFGKRHVSRHDENLGALSVDLTREEFAEVERLSSAFEMMVERYPEAVLRRSGL